MYNNPYNDVAGMNIKGNCVRNVNQLALPDGIYLIVVSMLLVSSQMTCTMWSSSVSESANNK